MYWLLGSESQLSIESKLLLYKAILKPIWTYGVQLWSTAANSNIKIIQRFRNKYLGTSMMLYITISTHEKLSQRYADRLEEHPNILAIDLMSDAETRRLKRKPPQDLSI